MTILDILEFLLQIPVQIVTAIIGIFTGIFDT